MVARRAPPVLPVRRSPSGTSRRERIGTGRYHAARVRYSTVTANATDLQAAFIEALRGDAGPLPPGPQTQPRDEISAAHRRRLVAGMAQALSAKGLARTTVADVVREAQVSRRTFYELFEDKASCLLATYDACADVNMSFVEAAVAPADGRTWTARIEAGVATYLQTMAALPDLARVFIVELPSAGTEAWMRIHAVHQRFAVLLTRLVDEHRDDLPDGVGLDPLIATAIVGGINELVMQALASGESPDTPERHHTAMRLLLGAMQPLGELADARAARA